MWNLQRALAEISGLPHISLQPVGRLPGRARGRAADPRLPRGARRARDEGPRARHRRTAPTPRRSDGRLRASSRSATDARRRRRPRRPAAQGAIRDVACLMLTNPNTLGLFDRNIWRSPARPRRGGDAVLRRREPQRRRGLSRPATSASTSCTSTCTRPSPRRTAAAAPAPGRSPCQSRIEPFLPVPQSCVQRDGRHAATLDYDRAASRSAGMRGFHGNFGVLRARLRLHPLPRRRRPARGRRDRRAQRQLPAARACGRAYEYLPYDRSLHARVRALRRAR